VREPAAGAVAHPAAGVLTPPARLPRISSLRQSLGRRRLPRYGSVAVHLQEAGDRSYIAQLWQAVFGETRATDDPYEDLCEFARRVDRERFPVDLWATSQSLGDAERPTEVPIYIGGYGVPWEVVGFDGVDPPDRAMVAVVCTAGVPTLGIPPVATYRDTASRHHDDLLTWWAAHGYDQASIPALTWPRDPGVAVAVLETLEPPLDGLATLYRCVVKDAENPFLDLPRGYWQGEYVQWEWDWYWDSPSIRELTDLFEQVRAEVERLLEYYAWWNQTIPDAEAAVVAALVGLERSEVYEELRDDEADAEAAVDEEWAACLCP